MPNVKLERQDRDSGASVWKASLKMEPDEAPIERWGRSVSGALRKLVVAVGESESKGVEDDR